MHDHRIRQWAVAIFAALLLFASPSVIAGQGVPGAAATQAIPPQDRAVLDQIQAALDGGNDRLALSLADQAIAKGTGISEFYRMRATAKRRLGDLDGTIADATRAVELDPGNARAFNARGGARSQKGDAKGALADADRAVQLNPQYHQGFDARALFKTRMNDYAGALPDADRAIALNDTLANYWIRRAQIRTVLGDLPGAETDLARGLALRPNDAIGLNSRARVRLAQGRLDDAIADASQVLAGAPLNPVESHRVRGEAYRKKGMIAEAERDEAQVRRLTPTQQWDASTEMDRIRRTAAAAPARPAPTPAPAQTPAPARAATPSAATAPRAGAPAAPAAPAAAVAASGIVAISLPPKLDPSEMGATTWGGQAAVALEAMRVLMGPLSPEETKRFEKMWAAHIQTPSPESDAYFAKLNPKLQELASLRGSLGQTAFEMESAWQEAVMAAGYGAEDAAVEALSVAKSHARTVAGLEKRMATVAEAVAAQGPPPDDIELAKEAKRRHLEATRAVNRLLASLAPPPAGAAARGPVTAEWRQVRVEQSTNRYLKPADEWSGTEAERYLAQGLSRNTKVAFNAGDGSLNSSVTTERQQGKNAATGKDDIKTIVSAASITWRPPPTKAAGGTVWDPGASISQSADGDFLLMKNVSFTVDGDGGTSYPPGRKFGPSFYYDRVFPPAPSQPAVMALKVQASGPSGAVTVTYLYETVPTGAAPSAAPEEVTVPDEYPAEGRVGELADEIKFTQGSIERLRAQLSKETDADRRGFLEEQVLQAETSIQRDRDLIASIETGQPVYTRTAWDDRASTLLVKQMQAEVDKLAELQRNQAAVLRMSQALTRFADKTPAEANEIKAFIRRQLIESGAASGGDIKKAREVANALANKVLGTFEGESAKNEEQAAMWDEYTHYAKTIQTMSTTVVGTAMAEVGAVMMAPVWMARAGSAMYAGFTGFVATGSPVEAAKEAVGWAHPIGAIGTQVVTGYQEGGAWGVAEGMVKGVAIGWLMHQSTQLATKAAGTHNFTFTPPKSSGSVTFTVKDFTESKEFRQDAAQGKAKVRAFEEAQQELKAYAQAGADPGTLKRLQDQVNARANVILEDPHSKFYLLKSGQASPDTKRLFSLHHETTHLKIQQKFERIMTEEMGFNPQKHQPVRNATSEGTAGMDYDLALVEHPAWVQDPSGKLVRNNWLTRNGQPASISQYQDAASRAYRRAFRDVTGGDANKAWENVITGVNPEAYKDRGAAFTSVADPNSFLHPEAGSGRFGGWLDMRNKENVAKLKSQWTQQAGDVTVFKGHEFTNPNELAWKGLSKLEGMHEAVRGTAKDVDKLLTLINQGMSRAQGADAKNLLAARNHWARVQETMTSYAKGDIGAISFRHKLHQMTGRMTVNEVIADLGGSMEVLGKQPPG